MTASELAARLNARAGVNEWLAKCPAHDDAGESLSIRRGRTGRPLLKCRAGCSARAVLAASGLSMRDLGTPSEERTAEGAAGFAIFRAVRAFRSGVQTRLGVVLRIVLGPLVCGAGLYGLFVAFAFALLLLDPGDPVYDPAEDGVPPEMTWMYVDDFDSVGEVSLYFSEPIQTVDVLVEEVVPDGEPRPAPGDIVLMDTSEFFSVRHNDTTQAPMNTGVSSPTRSRGEPDRQNAVVRQRPEADLSAFENLPVVRKQAQDTVQPLLDRIHILSSNDPPMSGEAPILERLIRLGPEKFWRQPKEERHERIWRQAHEWMGSLGLTSESVGRAMVADDTLARVLESVDDAVESATGWSFPIPGGLEGAPTPRVATASANAVWRPSRPVEFWTHYRVTYRDAVDRAGNVSSAGHFDFRLVVIDGLEDVLIDGESQWADLEQSVRDMEVDWSDPRAIGAPR